MASSLMEATMSELIHVNELTFQNEVLGANKPVLVDFSAVWCQPCKMLDPVVKQLAGEWEGKVKVVKIDADENPNLVMQYGVMGIPTLLFMKGGEVKERVTGYMPKEKLIAKFSPHFG
jgi:thioredoxin 1